MKFKFFVTIFVIVTLIFELKSQNYLPAKYIDKQGNEFEGKININRLNFSKQIKFYSNEKEFVYLNTSNTNEITISEYGRFVSNIIDDTFVELLIEGEINIYKVNEEFVLLKNGIKYKLQNTKLQWKGLLKLLVSDCVNENFKFDNNISFSKIEIIKLIENYNLCRNNLKFNYVKLEKPKLFTLGPQFGYAFSQMSFYPKDYTLPRDRFKFGKPISNSLSFGIRFTSEPGGKSQNISLEINPFFVFEVYKSKDLYLDANYEVKIESNIETNSVVIPTSLNYKYFENEKLKLMLNFGLGMKINSNEKFKAKFEERLIAVNYIRNYEENRLDDLNNFQIFGTIGHNYIKKVKEEDFGISFNALFLTKHTKINLKSIVTFIQLSSFYNLKV
jgi:hypothetical protein